MDHFWKRQVKSSPEKVVNGDHTDYCVSGGFRYSPMHFCFMNNISATQTGGRRTMAQGLLPVVQAEAQVKALLKEGNGLLSIIKASKKGRMKVKYLLKRLCWEEVYF